MFCYVGTIALLLAASCAETKEVRDAGTAKELAMQLIGEELGDVTERVAAAERLPAEDDSLAWVVLLLGDEKVWPSYRKPEIKEQLIGVENGLKVVMIRQLPKRRDARLLLAVAALLHNDSVGVISRRKEQHSMIVSRGRLIEANTVPVREAARSYLVETLKQDFEYDTAQWAAHIVGVCK